MKQATRARYVFEIWMKMWRKSWYAQLIVEYAQLMLHIFNHWSDSVNDLQTEFGRFGNIVDIMIPVDLLTKSPKGYCFIEFEDYYQAEDAFYSLHLSTFFGQKIKIDYAISSWKSKTFHVIFSCRFVSCIQYVLFFETNASLWILFSCRRNSSTRTNKIP